MVLPALVFPHLLQASVQGETGDAEIVRRLGFVPVKASHGGLYHRVHQVIKAYGVIRQKNLARIAQIQDSGAALVAAPCFNCLRQIEQLADYYDADVGVTTVFELFDRAVRC